MTDLYHELPNNGNGGPCQDGEHQYVTDRDWERNVCAHCGQPEPPLSELLGTETVLAGSGWIESEAGDDTASPGGSNGVPEPTIRVLVAIDYYGDGRCVAEAISHHRSCSVVVEADSGGPTGALRALADQIDANEDHYRGVPE